MHNHHPQSAHLQSNQPKLLLAQTHRVMQCDITTDDSAGMDQQPTQRQVTNINPSGRWQRLLQQLKKMLLPGFLSIATLLVPQTQAGDVSISVQGQIQPGVYGEIHVGQPAVRVYQQPVYHQPVYVERHYSPHYAPHYAPQPVYVQTVLVQAPKKHRKHWRKYCHHYGACQQRVQFVEVDYQPRQYEKVYVYQDRDYGRRVEKRHYHRGHD